MSGKSIRSPRPGKAAGPAEVVRLKSELARIEREQAKLNRERTDLAASIEEKAKAAAQAEVKPKRKKRKAKRSWKDGRPPIPFPDFPLSPHGNGRWQKKINGKLHYFGRWGRIRNGKMERLPGDGWQEALALYKAQKDDLYAGRTPRANSEGLTVKQLGDRFLTVKKNQLNSGDLAARTFAEYYATAQRLADTFGKDRLVTDLAADDFEGFLADIAKLWGPVRRGNEVQRVRTIFKYAYDAGLIDKPIRYGPAFKRPSRRVLRKHRAGRDKRLFTAEEIRQSLAAAGFPLKAMVLLGINCAFGNHDCGTLPISAVDLKTGWVNFPRPKTGIERRCPLWPETVEALREAIAERPQPKDSTHAGLVFITKYGKPWAKDTPDSPVSGEFGKLLGALGINGRKGLGFYSLRHTFRTVADATKDFPAIRMVMGHADDSIDAVYREGIDDERLCAVVEHVRAWLWPPAKAKAKSTRTAMRGRDA